MCIRSTCDSTEVLAVITDLDSSKAVGPSSISTYCLKFMKYGLPSPIRDINLFFHKCYDHTHVDRWHAPQRDQLQADITKIFEKYMLPECKDSSKSIPACIKANLDSGRSTRQTMNCLQFLKKLEHL